jgi:hypothetical protein
LDLNDISETLKMRPGLFDIDDIEMYENMKPEEKDFVNRLIKTREKELYERLAKEFQSSKSNLEAKTKNVELNSKGF